MKSPIEILTQPEPVLLKAQPEEAKSGLYTDEAENVKPVLTETDQKAIIHPFVFGQWRGQIVVGLTEEGTPQNLIIHLEQETLANLRFVNAWASNISVFLQNNLPLSNSSLTNLPDDDPQILFDGVINFLINKFDKSKNIHLDSLSKASENDSFSTAKIDDNMIK